MAWRERVAQAYEHPGEAAVWLSSAAAGWTHAEAQLVEGFRVTEGRTLVIGSGGGRELVALALSGGGAVGVDIAGRLLTAYRSSVPGSIAQPVVRADMGSLPLKAESFDTVLLCNQVLCHAIRTEERIRTLREALRVLRPGGRVLLSLYVGTPEDYSLVLEAWRLVVRRRIQVGSDQTPMTSIRIGSPIRRRMRQWVRGKAFRLLSVAVSLRPRSRDSPSGVLIALSETGRPTARRIPAHLYRSGEFEREMRAAGGEAILWRSHSELIVHRDGPQMLRRLDHLQFWVVARRPAD